MDPVLSLEYRKASDLKKARDILAYHPIMKTLFNDKHASDKNIMEKAVVGGSVFRALTRHALGSDIDVYIANIPNFYETIKALYNMNWIEDKEYQRTQPSVFDDPNRPCELAHLNKLFKHPDCAFAINLIHITDLSVIEFVQTFDLSCCMQAYNPFVGHLDMTGRVFFTDMVKVRHVYATTQQRVIKYLKLGVQFDKESLARVGVDPRHV